MGEPDIAAVDLIDLESVRKFIVVAEELNFTRAAARLGHADPAITLRVYAHVIRCAEAAAADIFAQAVKAA